jgi:ABC-2 type transport system ATP-binding protein
MQLVIQNLSKTYPNGVAALRDVSLSISPGLFGLLGPNGAGKSTLMRILATLQEADRGTARLGDIDVLGDKEAVRRTLGYLPQEFGLYPKVSAEEMLDHFALLKGLTDRRERKETVQALLVQTNLYGARKRKLGTFSGGMRQRFGIAVALIGDPRLIIVDEPTAGLDPAERVRFLNLLSELGQNAVVILSTHIVEDVSDLCQRMAVIESGRILLEAEPLRAVEALRGKVWRRQVDRDELKRMEEALPVILTTLVAGRNVVHVYGDAAPDASFEPVEPDLKDVYFTAVRGIRIDATRPHVEAPLPTDLALQARHADESASPGSAPIISHLPGAADADEPPPIPPSAIESAARREPSPAEPSPIESRPIESRPVESSAIGSAERIEAPPVESSVIGSAGENPPPVRTTEIGSADANPAVERYAAGSTEPEPPPIPVRETASGDATVLQPRLPNSPLTESADARPPGNRVDVAGGVERSDEGGEPPRRDDSRDAGAA